MPEMLCKLFHQIPCVSLTDGSHLVLPESYENSPLPLVVCPKINHPLCSKCVFYFSVPGIAFQSQALTTPFSAG